jgi:hypothetical protein
MARAAKYIDDALKSYELATSLENIASDDKKRLEEYSVAEVVKEAEYVLSCYYEGGHCSNDELRGDAGPEARKTARREVRILTNYIKKYKP